MDFAAGGGIALNEMIATASRTAFPAWGGADEPSIRVAVRLVTCPPFAEESIVLAEVGLHALARRYQRGRPDDDAAVLRDFRAFAGGYADAAEAGGGEVAIEAPSGGRWVGAVAAVAGATEPVMAVRTYIS